MKHLSVYFLIVLIGISTTVNAQSTQLSVEPYQFENQEGQKVDAELGKFSVPENRTKADSRNIDLYFVRFKSTNPNPGSPIVYLAGGPGGSGIGTAKGRRFELFMKLREVADVIAFDQRGTGMSNHIPACEAQSTFPLDKPGDAETYFSTMAETAKTCLTFWNEQGIDVEGYNTRENASDLEDLRKVLGVPKLNLWGISYGSHLGFAFVKQYESSIDRMVLVGLEGPDHTIKLPAYNQNYLKRLQAKINLDEQAKALYPDLLGLMGEVLDKLEKEPAYAEATNPRTGKTHKIGISKLDVQLVTSFFLTKNPENSVQLPFIYKQMQQGDFSRIAEYVGYVRMYAGRVNGMSLAMDAMSGVSPARWKKIQEQAKHNLLGRTTNFPYPDITLDLGLPDLGDTFRENPVSNVPALFFSGTLDGRTYLESAEELIAGFGNSSHVILDGAGHDMFTSTPKVLELMLAFYQGEKVQSQTIEIDVPDFVIQN